MTVSSRSHAVRIHYHRPDQQYDGWGLHIWGDTPARVTWQAPLAPTGFDADGPYWDVELLPRAQRIGFVVHKGDRKDPGQDQFLQPLQHGHEVWIVSGRIDIHTARPDIEALRFGDLRQLRAHWISRQYIFWDEAAVREPRAQVYLHVALDDTLKMGAAGVSGGESIALLPAGDGAMAALQPLPHLANAPRARAALFELPAVHIARAAALVRGQVAMSVTSATGELVAATGVQMPGVLDDLFLYSGPLGVQWNAGRPSLHLWAPTARAVRLLVFAAPEDPTPHFDLALAANAGVWSITGDASWQWLYYQFEVEVFVPRQLRLVRHRVTDPYSRSLSMNSTHSQFVDLADAAMKPPGWDSVRKPTLRHATDIVLYELHVRDFSASDTSVPAHMRGKYMAFGLDSQGTRHLRELSASGITHVHLLPVFDIASIDEDPNTWQETPGLETFGPDSDRQQQSIHELADADPYNWGYDPWHYGVPEGSYALNPRGARPMLANAATVADAASSPGRIYEFRAMVQALAGLGLRVVMDVVYNHMHASGLDRHAVLDRIVPGYYHRLDGDGKVLTSTCCANTASEHAMMERLMIDDLVHWAINYKVDGFRFDLMGHHLKRNMVRARDTLRALTPEHDGVDGAQIYLYGEGWDFGEVANNARGVNASQRNLAGTGIGTFNDRLRDAVRGGNPFGDRRQQGFATGLALAPNQHHGLNADDGARLLEHTDRIRIGLAGNLAEYVIEDFQGTAIRGDAMSYAGYVSEPSETINYVSAHDNETLFDKIQWAAAENLTIEERVRMQMIAISLVALGQGIPFFDAGVEILRSKSLDCDSYNSGDWFNRLDFSCRQNNFGVGLPPAEKNRERWDLMRPLLARTGLRPTEADMRRTLAHFQCMLRIRRSSPLFHLQTARDIHERLRFLNTGPQQHPGVIVMLLADDGTGLADLDPATRQIIVIFNARGEPATIQHRELGASAWRLHPALVDAVDPVVRTAHFDAAQQALIVPARTAAVFVR